MRQFLALGLIAVLGACTYQANVPQFDGAPLAAVGDRQPGRYVAIVQTGGWDMKAEFVGITCAMHGVNADLNPTWDNGMRSALTAAIETVDFLAEPLSPDALARQGYAGQIAIQQSGARTRIAVGQRVFYNTAISETRLDGILVVTLPDGTVKQEPLTGAGLAQNNTFACNNVGDAVGAAGAQAVRAIVRQAVTTTKLLLAQGGRRSS